MRKLCVSPKATKRVVNPGTGVKAFCPSCRSWQPAAQVRWGQEKRNARGEITATYAPLAHGEGTR
jgi:hypothetical protein